MISVPDGPAAEPEELLGQLQRRLHVWITEPRSDPGMAWTAATEGLLTDEERARHRRFMREADRDLFLSARVLVRRTLSRYCDIAPAEWTFRRNQFGRPEISNRDAPSGLRFNLSHTEGMVALMVHDVADGGVDVERLGRVTDLPSVARLAFAGIEQQQLEALPDAQHQGRFYRLWTLKEAFIKATGQGLSMPLKDFWFSWSDDGSFTLDCRESIEREPRAWTFTVRQPSAHHVLATAYRSGVGRPVPEVDLRRVTLT